MDKSYKYIIIATCFIIIFSGFSYAESKYVTDITKITMRSAPDAEHKIITMLQSGTAINVLEQSGSWSKVRTKDGKEGWALTRFLVNEKPAVILLGAFERENKKLKDRLADLKTEHTKLAEKNKKLAGIEEKYIELEKGAKSFLELKKEYQSIRKEYDDQQEMISSFEDNYKNKIMIWFLIGAGVFVFGVLLGMGAKKNRRSYLR
ncbi:MAG: TIGR04211 family SH3 domain-containing protein [Desulfobacteraceae bacterium]|nr:TIGR04211 family SH3 domain-containing protein [Desulfobacteraceae bacterium]